MNTFNYSCWEIRLVSYGIIQRLAQWDDLRHNFWRYPLEDLEHFCSQDLDIYVEYWDRIVFL